MMLSTYQMETSSLDPAQENDRFKDAEAPQELQPVNRRLEAARYALLQRLVPAIRHQVAGTFQPIIMLASMLQKLAQSPNVDLAKVGTHSASIHNFSHSSATASLNLFSWVTSCESVEVSINDGVRECLDLVTTELALREFTIDNQLSSCTENWPRGALRHVFMPALLAITDVAPSPAELVLSAEESAASTALILTIRSADDAAVRESVPIYRKIEWLDLEVLAQAEGVSLERIDGGIKLLLSPHC